MSKEDFFNYMGKQINEIEKYKKNQLKLNSHLDCNSCVFDWIQKNAKKFYEKWNKC